MQDFWVIPAKPSEWTIGQRVFVKGEPCAIVASKLHTSGALMFRIRSNGDANQ